MVQKSTNQDWVQKNSNTCLYWSPVTQLLYLRGTTGESQTGWRQINKEWRLLRSEAVTSSDLKLLGGSDPEIWRELDLQALVEIHRPTRWEPGDIYVGFSPPQASELLPGPNSSSQVDPVDRGQPSRVQSGVGKGEEQLWWGGAQRLPSTFLESFGYNFRGSLIFRNQSANSPWL